MANKTWYNIVAKPHKECSYALTDMMATKLTERQFNKIKELNPDLLGDYIFIPYNDTDFSWWSRVTRYLTLHKIRRASFEVDYFGRITKY